MLLHQALEVKVNDVISFVGAGGKTTAALRLMEELAGIQRRVVFTTTTKILEPIPRGNEYLLLADEEEALAQVPELLTRYPKVFLAQRRLEEVDLTALGESDRDYPMRPNKVEGVRLSVVDHLAQRLSKTVILIEADGARHRALKAPAAYEPVVPASTTILVPMADLTVLGKPLTEKHVHRPELVADLTGAAIGELVTVEMVATVLSHPQGGLKGLPEQARAIPILNQMEQARPLDEACEIAHLVLRNERIERVIIASLRASEPVLEVIPMTNDQISIINRQSAIGNRQSAAVAAIVLAAGESQRFGQPKQLLPVGGKTMLQHVVDIALDSPLEQVIVVLGCRAAEIRASIAGRPVQVVVNEKWKSGLSSSVRTGLSAVKPEVDAAVFVLADQPGVTAEIIAKLAERYQETRASIVVPTQRGQRGNPVLFARSLFAELMAVKGDQGGRRLIAEYVDELEEVEVQTEAIFMDIDTPDDYQTANLQSTISNIQSPTFNSLIIDMDGVIYRGDQAIVGAKEFVALLQREGVPFLFLTNNSTRTPGQYVTKLDKMGIAIEEKDVLTSAQATALYLEKIALSGSRVYAIGEEGLRAALREKYTIAEEEASFVVVGMDTRLTYEKLKTATLLIRGGARFIATNPDKTLPTEEGLVPGNGAAIAALEAATGVIPFVVGKPEPAIFDLALARMGVGKEGAAVIGDRLETDILGGQMAGLSTILVLSGAASRQELENSTIKPDLVFENVRQLYEAWPRS
ncbi:MAG: molybdenum cofactor cytidylyltransferase [Anaerolineales bacterium]|nr:molybdenum cofactor cytidylyltransferase [Anaerolineales bacterium]